MRESYVLVGAGSVSFTRGLVADIIRQGRPCDLALVDTNADSLAVAEGFVRKLIDAEQAPISLRASTDRRDVFVGATAIICTVGVGGRKAWEQDVFVPRKHGIYQPVGDSVMPGGSSRALRMIPAMVAIAQDAAELAPDALFLNYSNPMGPICRAIRKATDVKVIGLCHGVNHVSHYIAQTLGCSLDEMQYTAIGMNHLTWFTEVSINGVDAMPRLKAIAHERLAAGVDPSALGSGFAEAGTAQNVDLSKVDNPFTWQCTELFGAFPAVLDRHITEFFAPMFHRKGSYYGVTLGVEAYSFQETIAYGDAEFAEMRRIAESPEPLPRTMHDSTGGEHEQVIDIIHSIRTDSGTVFSANLPNTGQIPNLPLGSVVECPAVASKNGLEPIQQRPLSSGIAGSLATRMLWVETVVEAALEGSREKFVQALILDGAVESVQQAYALADDLLAVQAQYLPQFG